MITTKFENGRFWLVDSVTLASDPRWPSFSSWLAAVKAAGDEYIDPGPQEG
jgi:hypothetical protein